MSWPWEALHSRNDGYLALRCCIDRQLSNIGDPPPLASALPRDIIHILYIIPRPYGEGDVVYHILANSMVDFISKNGLPVTVDVLRPPTFDQLLAEYNIPLVVMNACQSGMIDGQAREPFAM